MQSEHFSQRGAIQTQMFMTERRPTPAGPYKLVNAHEAKCNAECPKQWLGQLITSITDSESLNRNYEMLHRTIESTKGFIPLKKDHATVSFIQHPFVHACWTTTHCSNTASEKTLEIQSDGGVDPVTFTSSNSWSCPLLTRSVRVTMLFWECEKLYHRAEHQLFITAEKTLNDTQNGWPFIALNNCFRYNTATKPARTRKTTITKHGRAETQP